MQKRKIVFVNDSKVHNIQVMIKITPSDNYTLLNTMYYAWDSTIDLPISYEIIDGKNFMHYVDANEETCIIDYMLKLKRANYYYSKRNYSMAFGMMSEVNDAADTIVYENLNADCECEFI